MKTLILCGGRGTRLDHHGESVPKGLFPIGGDPLILHLIRIYKHHGLNDFALCLGYLAEAYSRYFEQEILDPKAEIAHRPVGSVATAEGVRLDLFDTGLDTPTGGRIKKLETFLNGEERFCITYGDGLADIDLGDLIRFHRQHGKLATITAVNPVSSFGILDLGDDGAVHEFREKPRLDDWINGGFFVFERGVLNYLSHDSVLEREPFVRLAQEGQLMAYKLKGFWKCMDTFKDNREMNDLWEASRPWKVW